MQQIAQSDEQLVRIIRQREGEITAQSFSDRVATTTLHIDCKFLCQYLPPLEVRRRASALLASPPDWLTSDDRKALQVVVASIAEDGSVHDARTGRRPRPKDQGERAGDPSEANEAEGSEGEVYAET